MSTKDISLAGELLVIEHALDASRLLLETDGTCQPSLAAARSARAALILTTCRLGQLRRAVVGALDPAVLHSAHNEVLEPTHVDDDADVVLPARE
jgi:hypothetical protein